MKKSERYRANLVLRHEDMETEERVNSVKKARQDAKEWITRRSDDDLNFDLILDNELARVRAMIRSKMQGGCA